MVFSSISFIFLILSLFLILDRLAALKSPKWRNATLLAVSLLFYVWGEAANVFILLAMGTLNFIGGRLLARPGRRRLTAGLFVALDMAVLFIFKYLAWLVNMAGLEKPLQIALPLGISFFTFHAISYIVDVYRRDVEPAKGLAAFMTYFCMFPHLVAGPIVRYRQVEGDLAERPDDAELFHFGVYRFILGLNKKCLIANLVAPLADVAFWPNGLASAADAWLGAVAYTLQIYFDFSGYSDMAIGLAALAGFRFRENFDRPYSATSVRDFWKRWHISLSSFFKDYLYIPLGGNRGGQVRTLFNLLAVFFFCGLWHGANATFIAWGLWHGLFLVIERLGLGDTLSKLPRFVGRAYTMLVVTVGWVFFRAYNLDHARQYLGVMFSPSTLGSPSYLIMSAATLALAAGLVICHWPDRLLPKPDSRNPGAFPVWWMALQAVLLIGSFMVLVSGSRNPFIYFNF